MSVVTYGLFIWNEDEEWKMEMMAAGCREKASIDFLPQKLEA